MVEGEVVEALARLREHYAEGRLSSEELEERITATFNAKTFGDLRAVIADLPDPELVIRTGGELRLSNFLLFQAAYAEFWATNTYWPDFGEAHLRAALADFGSRHRRYGT